MECELTDQRFAGQEFVLCQFTDSRMDGVDFSGAVLTQSNFKGALLRKANFSGADACNTLFEAHMSGANCSGGRFDQSIWIDARVEGVDFGAARLPLSVFHRARCTDANFREAELQDADFSYAELLNADMRGAHFLRMCFHRALQQGLFLGAWRHHRERSGTVQSPGMERCPLKRSSVCNPHRKGNRS